MDAESLNNHTLFASTDAAFRVEFYLDQTEEIAEDDAGRAAINEVSPTSIH